jgi:hypothetical protein
VVHRRSEPGLSCLLLVYNGHQISFHLPGAA